MIETGIRLLNMVVIGGGVGLILTDSLPGQIIRALMVAPAYEAGLLSEEFAYDLIVGGLGDG